MSVDRALRLTITDVKRLLAEAKVHPDSMPSGTALRITAAFATLYARKRLLTSKGCSPLWECCSHGDSCWRDAEHMHPADGGIALPWVGTHYRPGGVLLLAMNFNDASGLASTYAIADGDREWLAAGRKRINYGDPTYHGTDFPYRSARSAAAVLDHLAGREAVDRDDPTSVANVVDRVVRLQAIKCSPVNDYASQPTDTMWTNCPPLLLEGELAIARPGTIIGFGGGVQWVLDQLPAFERSHKMPGLVRGRYRTKRLDVEVFLMAHPRANGYWQTSQRSLVKALN